MRVYIPTINDSQPDFDILFELWNTVNQDGLDVTFDFTGCRFLRQNAVAFIGGLARLVVYRAGFFKCDWKTLSETVSKNLGRNGLLSALGRYNFYAKPQGAIPYRADTSHDQEYGTPQCLDSLPAI